MGGEYLESGVDLKKGEGMVSMIKELSKRQMRKEVLRGVGGFQAMFKLGGGYRSPVLVSCTDGVGTKLRVAIESGKHRGIGLDLVGMCVNDLATSGAEPLFFLDYYGANRIEGEVLKEVICGILEGCKECGMSLVGGEIAEMRGMYRDEGGYDLAGFVVGVVEEGEVIDGSKIGVGDYVIGLESSGFHSNGYSLIRKVLFEENGYGLRDWVSEFGKRVEDILLEPTRLYVRELDRIKRRVEVKGLAHITGGGVEWNVGRIVPKGLEVYYNDRKMGGVFEWIRGVGGIGDEEMGRVFNLGVGMVVIIGRGELGCFESIEGLGGWEVIGEVRKV